MSVSPKLAPKIRNITVKKKTKKKKKLKNGTKVLMIEKMSSTSNP
jgi:hypothetical protein